MGVLPALSCAIVTDDFDQRTGLPRSNRDQSGAFCGKSRPLFVHRLDPAHGRSFWATCGNCEELIAQGDDDALFRLMMRQEDDAVLQQASLDAFRAADLGTNPLEDAP